MNIIGIKPLMAAIAAWWGCDQAFSDLGGRATPFRSGARLTEGWLWGKMLGKQPSGDASKIAGPPKAPA